MQTAEERANLDSAKKDYIAFQDILSEEELDALFDKYGVTDERERKLCVRSFFWLMILSASQSSQRGSIMKLIGYFLGIVFLLFPEKKVTSLSKNAVSKRLNNVSWYLFRGVYNHLLNKYNDILDAKETKYLNRFKDALSIDGSVISLSKELEKILASVHKGKSSLKLNVRYSLKTAVVNKLQVTSGRRHDSKFSFVTQESNLLYLVDLGYWSFTLMQKIINAGSFFVLRLKGNCDPLIIAVTQQEYSHLVGKRLSEIKDFLTECIAIGEIDLTVQLSKAKKPRFKEDIRLVGMFHEEQWQFYVTNIVETDFTPSLIYRLYAERWQVEIFFNLIKNVLNLEKIISRNKNGIMIEIYSALIFHILTRIIIALAAQKTGTSIHQFSFECSYKLVENFLMPHFHLFLQAAWDKIDALFLHLVDIIAAMGLANTTSQSHNFHEEFA